MTAVHRLLRARQGELAPLALSAAFFFCVLFGYQMIRPVREAMGVERGMDELQVLFVFTAVASLAVAMAFGTLVHRLDRRVFIPVGFRAVMLCLVVFAALRLGFGDEVKAATGRVFYVWLSVVNLFLTSVFWAFMADLWSLEQGKRLFPAIGVGGTLGAIAGSSVPWMLSEHIGAPGLMLCAACVFECGVRFMRRLVRTQRSQGLTPAQPTGTVTFDRIGLIDGLAFIARSPYLVGIGLYIVLIAVSSTFVYFTQAELVVNAEAELVDRIAMFGQLDWLAQVFTLLVQLFVTSRVIRMIGIGGTLGVLPVITLVGFATLWFVSGLEDVEPWQVFAVFAVFQALHRAGRFAVARPARETLFSVLSRDEKYKAKVVIDMFAYRGGDVAGAQLYAVLASVAALSVASVPLALVWAGLGAALALGQSRRAASHETKAPLGGTQATAGLAPANEGETR